MKVVATASKNAGMAQSVEHVIGNDEVISSILITSSKETPYPNRDEGLLVFIGIFQENLSNSCTRAFRQDSRCNCVGA